MHINIKDIDHRSKNMYIMYMLSVITLDLDTKRMKNVYFNTY